MLNNLLKKPVEYYSINRDDILKFIPENVKYVLDVGCGEGRLGEKLKKAGVKEVIGIELNIKAGKKAKKVLNHVYIGDVEKVSFPFKKKHFDCMICGDILEHLIDPCSVLIKLQRYLKNDGILIASIPNVGHYTIIYRLILGRWDYQSSGILDKTHLRFFTLKTIKALFNEAGYDIIKIKRNYLYSKLIKIITLNLIKLFKRYSTYQYIVIARKSCAGL